jgi:hypothetical protein
LKIVYTLCCFSAENKLRAPYSTFMSLVTG